jgi:phosphate transport system protein
LLQIALSDLLAQVREFAATFGEADFYTGAALAALSKTAPLDYPWPFSQPMADEAIAISEQAGEKALALDELVIRILAKQSPVARDLRVLVSALRISASLERMSALAGHIASIARYRFPGTAVPDSLAATFAEMGNLDVSLAKQLVQLLKTTDADFAREIQAQDARVDELHRHVFDVVLGDDWKENAMFTVDVTLASRYHERFADHVVDISSKVSYLTTGDWADTE